jgi:hypothetical protein
MEVDDKKRKVEEISENEVIDLEVVLKECVDCNLKLYKLIAIVAQKVVNLEKVFNKDFFKSS